MKLNKRIILNKLTLFAMGLMCLVFNFTSVFSQDAAVLDWIYQTYGYGNELAHGIVDMVIDSEDNILVSGGVGSGIVDINPDENNEYLIDAETSFGKGYMAKYSPTGNLLWALEMQLAPALIVLDNEDNIFTSGEINRSIDFDPSPNEYIVEPDARELYLAKYDSEGNFLWVNTTQTQGSSQMFVNDLAICSQTSRVTVSGIFAGNVDVNPDENESDVLSTEAFHIAHAFAATYDLDGEFIWATDFYVQNMISPAREYQVTYDDNGSLFLSGQFHDTLQLDLTENIPPLFSIGAESHQYDAFIAKFSLIGELEWIIGLHGPERIVSRDITIYDDNLYVVGMLADEATFYSSLKTDSVEISYHLNPRPFVAKYNILTGEILWAFDMNVTDNSYGGGYYIKADISGCYISGVFGGTESVDFNPDPNTEHLMTNNSGNQEAFLAKYTSDGDFAWAFSTPGGVFTEPKGLQVLSDDRVVLAGSYRGNVDVSGYGSGDSISSYFTSSINHHVFMGVYKQGMLSLNEVVNKGVVSLFPNPTADKLTIKLSGYKGKDVRIVLYDIQGRSLGTLLEGKLNGENTTLEFDVSHLSSGVYIYNILIGNQNEVLRFIKE
jgi:hypothetical protein